MSRKKTNFEESLLRNQHTYAFYLDILAQIAMSRFEWINIPDGIDERYLELKLFENGSAIWFQDEVLNEYLCLAMLYGGGFTVYGDPVKRTAWSGYNNYSKKLDPTDSVVIWNNMSHTNTVLPVTIYAERLYNADRTIDVNLNAQKTPILLRVPEKQRLTVLNLYKEYDGNAPVIYGDKDLNKDSITTLTTGAPFVSDKVYNIKIQIWNEILTFLGISNSSVTKKERVNTDEVNRALGGTFGCRFSALSERKKACRKINKLFGLNIDVKFREVDTLDTPDPDESEVDDNEQVYN